MSAGTFAIDMVNVRGRERAIEQAIDADQTILISTRLIDVGKALGILDRLDQVKGVIFSRTPLPGGPKILRNLQY